MTIYTVHCPARANRGSLAGLERAVLVKDGFHWLAFLFPMVWPLFNRLWVVTFAVAAVLLGVWLGLPRIGAPGWLAGALELLTGLAMGVFASELKSGGLARRSMPAVDVVGGTDREDAERRFFARWLAGREQISEPRPGTGPAFPPPPHVLGLFPDSGGGSRL